MTTALDVSAIEVRDEIAAGRISAVEVCRAALDRASTINGELHAFNLCRSRVRRCAAPRNDMKVDLLRQ